MEEELEEEMDEPIVIQDYPEETNVTSHRSLPSHSNNHSIGKVRGQHTRPIQSRLAAPKKLSAKSLKSIKPMEAAQVRCLTLRFLTKLIYILRTDWSQNPRNSKGKTGSVSSK